MCEKDEIHESHIGVQGCLRRAGEKVYWPGPNSEVTDLHCDGIQTLVLRPSKFHKKNNTQGGDKQCEAVHFK